MSSNFLLHIILYALINVTLLSTPAAPSGVMAQDRAMEVEDIMSFRQIADTDFSRSGIYAAYELSPDRGDGQVELTDQQGNRLLTIDRGTNPRLSSDDRWIMSRVHRPFRERMRESSSADSLVVLRSDRSDTLAASNVEKARFSEDSRWLVVLQSPEEDDQPGERSKPGGKLSVYSLVAQSDTDMSDTDHRLFFETGDVRDFTVDSLSTQLIYSVIDSTGSENGLYGIDLAGANHNSESDSGPDSDSGSEPEYDPEDDPDSGLDFNSAPDSDSTPGPIMIHRQKHGIYNAFSWHEEKQKLAFLSSREDSLGNPAPASVHFWDAINRDLDTPVTAGHFSNDRIVPIHSELTWSDDGERLFFGWQPQQMYRYSLYEEEEEQVTVTDRDTILAGAEVDVWHGDDPLIKTHEKQTWERRRDHTYLTVYHLDSGRVVELADDRVPYVSPDDNRRYVLGRNPRPYKKQITWDGRYNDYYIIDLQDGSRREIIDRLRATTVSLSPGGRYVLFYEAEHWHLYDTERHIIRNITVSLDVSFANEDHDYPFPAPGYGMAGWVEGDRSVLIYDKYDIWQIDIRSGDARMLTAGEGRNQQRQFRIVQTDPDRVAFKRNEHLLARGYGERDKTYGFYGVRIGRDGYERFVEGPYRYRFTAASESGDRILYTRESYREFPDLHVADRRFRESTKLTNVNPQIEEFDWGHARLVRWKDFDGEELDGVLITPEDHEQGEPLPVLVYFYEQFSRRLHHFNEQVINHRPGFPFYVSNGYAVFLPDVRYDIGKPGYSATRSIVPGVQKLIEKGIADPDAVGLHGHSWSGYQAAHMVTQTHLFAAVIAGAPVSNMTSAYSGIRWGSGLARQFQYEQTQSRIGGSLWDKRERYIENSPVFFADRIQTPMMLMFGDVDGAVPWEQGIELYLAMRRLHKDVVFLQYRDEPHHPQKYANKLDYFLRMKEYLDHYLKGKPAPDWIRKGVPYRGN